MSISHGVSGQNSFAYSSHIKTGLSHASVRYSFFKKRFNPGRITHGSFMFFFIASLHYYFAPQTNGTLPMTAVNTR